MGCGCAERRAKMKAWVKKQQMKRIAKREEEKRLKAEALLKQEKGNEYESSAGN